MKRSRQYAMQRPCPRVRNPPDLAGLAGPRARRIAAVTELIEAKCCTNHVRRVLRRASAAIRPARAAVRRVLCPLNSITLGLKLPHFRLQRAKARLNIIEFRMGSPVLDGFVVRSTCMVRWVGRLHADSALLWVCA